MRKLNTMKKMTPKQQQCYDKAMNALWSVHQMLCNVNGPLPSVEDQGKVIRIIQDTEDKINALIKRK